LFSFNAHSKIHPKLFRLSFLEDFLRQAVNFSTEGALKRKAGAIKNNFLERKKSPFLSHSVLSNLFFLSHSVLLNPAKDACLFSGGYAAAAFIGQLPNWTVREYYIL